MAAKKESTLAAIHQKVDELNNGILPPGVTVVPMLDRSDLLHFTLNTVLHNLTEGMILVTIVLFLFLLNVRAALIVALTIPFSLLFASIWLNVSSIPANLLSLGALDFGMVVDGAVVMVENIIRHLSHRRQGGSGPAKSIKDVIREAEATLSQLIFLTRTDVPDINPYQFSDDNTEREVGHYFALQHPRFIKDAKTAMYTNLSKNRPEIASRMRGKLFASIDAEWYAQKVP